MQVSSKTFMLSPQLSHFWNVFLTYFSREMNQSSVCVYHILLWNFLTFFLWILSLRFLRWLIWLTSLVWYNHSSYQIVRSISHWNYGGRNKNGMRRELWIQEAPGNYKRWTVRSSHRASRRCQLDESFTLFSPVRFILKFWLPDL